MLPFLKTTLAALVKDDEERIISRMNPVSFRIIIFFKVLAFTKQIVCSAPGDDDKTRETSNAKN
jgi:hypothetical protein